MHDVAGVSQRLCAVVSGRDYARHPFVLGLTRRAYSQASLRHYAATLHRSTEAFVTLLYRLAAICPAPDVRAQLVGNLIEEEGFTVEAGAVTCAPGRRHAELSRRFALAVGVADEALSGPGDDVFGRWFDGALQERRWLAALANLTVGQESGAPALFGAIAAALRAQYDIGEHELEFFLVHVEADRAHAEFGARLCAQAARTPELEADAIDGARRGADRLWGTYRMLDAEMRRISAGS
jgi:pyrroloquinoline quinone (PQQ) biosynthesis protein C